MFLPGSTVCTQLEEPSQVAAIASLLIDAFGGADESQLVSDLRDRGDIVCALVAVDDAGIAGYVLFSRLSAEIDGQVIFGVALAPLAVRPDCRNRGLGADLVRAGLDRCTELGAGFAVVLGNPAYYSRFGFSVEAAAGLQSVFAGPYLQVLELAPEALGSGQGTLTYAAPFGRFS